MSNQSNTNNKIITNRQLNFTLCPVDTHNKKEMPYALPDYKIDGTWNQHQSIILDVLLDRLVKHMYCNPGAFPTSWGAQKVSEVVPGFFNGAINPKSLNYLNQSPNEAYLEMMGDTYRSQLKNFFDRKSSQAERFSDSFEHFAFRYLENDRGYQDFREEMDPKAASLHNDFMAPFIISKLFENYPELNKYRYSLQDHIRRIAETKFKMTYKVKYLATPPKRDAKTNRLTSRGKQIDIYYRMQNFESIFTADFDSDKAIINFNSPLGKMIIHNTLMLDTDWVSDEVFGLSKNAYFIYKRFILNRANAKKKKNEIDLFFTEIKTGLDMKWKNDRGNHSIIDRALNEIHEKGLVKGYRWEKGYRNNRRYIISFDTAEKAPGKEPGSNVYLLKIPA